jgi:hypothetical protein
MAIISTEAASHRRESHTTGMDALVDALRLVGAGIRLNCRWIQESNTEERDTI